MPMTDSGSEVAVDSTGQSGATEAQVNADSTIPAAPFGEWPSPITAAEVASGQVTGSFPMVAGGDTWWQVGLPDEGGRTTVMHDRAGKQTMLLPSPWNARTRVHEYGGLSYLPIPPSALPAQHSGKRASGHLLLFANFADQRLYLAGPGVAVGQEPARPLTPEPTTITAGSGSGTLPAAGLRYADFVLGPGRPEVWCVQERHEDGKVSRAIVAVPLDGSAAENARRDPDSRRRVRFLRLPDTVPGREVAGVDLLEPPAHAVGRDRTARRSGKGRDARQGQAAHGQSA